jgi:hypothetical protein
MAYKIGRKNSIFLQAFAVFLDILCFVIPNAAYLAANASFQDFRKFKSEASI